MPWESYCQKVGEEGRHKQIHTYSQHYAMELTITCKFKFVLNSLLNVPLEAYYSYINKQCCLLSFFNLITYLII